MPGKGRRKEDGQRVPTDDVAVAGALWLLRFGLVADV